MVAVVIIALTAGALGALAWAISSHRNGYGALLPAGIAVLAALLVWILTMALGLDGSASTAWLPWILSLVVGGIAAFATAGFMSRSRESARLRRNTEILQMH